MKLNLITFIFFITGSQSFAQVEKPYITNYLVSATPISPADSARGLRKNVDIDNDHDAVTHMVSNVKFKQGDIGKMQFFIKPHEGTPYQVVLQRKEDDSKWIEVNTIAEATEKDFFNFDFGDTPAGRYDLVIYPLDSSKKRIATQETRLDFTIKPLPVIERKITIKEILFYVAGSIVAIGLLFWAYRRQANIRLARSVQDKQNTNLKLRSIRSQLNPHFMFNALTSIQNLVNKNDMEGANLYLSKFADLTRKVLNTGERDLISLEEEVKVLDDYLQMEQLRFNFKYDIKLTDNVYAANIDVPAMLLQPFVENAVKHGVSNLREKGRINVLINKDQNNLVFAITDNGSGFNQENQIVKNGSFGLKLSEERVALLNEVYKDQRAILNIQSAATGTTVTITLTNWIS